jgi:hypothetical protein
VNFTAEVMTAAITGVTISTEPVLAPDISDPTTQEGTTADIMEATTEDIMEAAAITAAVVMVGAVTAVAEITISLHSPEVRSRGALR